MSHIGTFSSRFRAKVCVRVRRRTGERGRSVNVTLNCHTFAPTHVLMRQRGGLPLCQPRGQGGNDTFLPPPHCKHTEPRRRRTQTPTEASQGLTGADKSGSRHSSALPASPSLLPHPSPPGVGGER